MPNISGMIITQGTVLLEYNGKRVFLSLADLLLSVSLPEHQLLGSQTGHKGAQGQWAAVLVPLSGQNGF